MNWVIGIIEQYDFYYKTVVMGQLVKDQQQEKNPVTRFILQLNFQLEEKEADYKEEREMPKISSSISIPVSASDFPHLTGSDKWA